MSKCKLCDQGHEPVINGSSVEHWVVTGVRTARVTAKACKEPETAIARLTPTHPPEESSNNQPRSSVVTK